jgi:2-succinyl-6-hydroxy-2,4-cyclohexadiene-1-carboxylate synthase
MQYLNINGVRYAAHIVGSGTPLLFLHGFTGSGADWALFVPYFAQYYRVITIDMLGHGETDSPTDVMRYALKHVRRDLTTLLEDFIQEPAHLVGYSMGGRLALYLAINHQQLFRSLTLESASPGIADEEDRIVRKESDEDLADRIEQLGIAAFVDEWESMPLFETQASLALDVRRRQREARLNNNPIGLANSLRGYGTGVQPSLWAELPTLRLPTLLLAGERDAKFSAIARDMHALIPGSTLRLVPRAGHNTHLENPRGFATSLSEFLQSLSEK